MDKFELQERLNNFSGSPNELYKKLIYLDKEQTSFDKASLKELYLLVLFLFQRKNGIENISKNKEKGEMIRFEKEKNYKKFKSILEGYKEIEYKHPPDVSLQYINNLYDEIIRLEEVNILKNSDEIWTKVYSSKINQNEVKTDGKLYISIDNKHLYQFAYILLARCINEKLLDFEFKVNNDETINRRDNVVIYFTNENLNHYLSIIKGILKDCPNIKMNKGNLLAQEIENGIAIGRDYESYKGISFSQSMINIILDLKSKNIPNNIIADIIEEKSKEAVSDLLEIIDKEEVKTR